MIEVLTKIRQADDIEINQIINAVTQRYKEVFPDWEVTFLSLPKNDPDACLRELELIAEFVRNHCN